MLDRHHIRNARSRIVPNATTLVLRSRTSATAFTNYPVAGCRLKPLTKDQIVAHAISLPHKFRVAQLWHVELAAVSAPAPKQHDQITGTDESGTAFSATVDRVLERSAMGEVWNLLVQLNV